MKFTQNTIKRATRTFVQAAVAYIAVYLANYGTDELFSSPKTVLMGVFVSAIAAGLSAVMNLEQNNIKPA